MAVKRGKLGCMLGLAENYALNSAGQQDAMVAAVHQLRPQGHDTRTEDGLLRLVCLGVASAGASLAEHSKDLL